MPLLRNVSALARARLAMARRAGWPVPALFFHGVLAAGLALLVRDLLPPFPYALLALSVGALCLALPLLSDLGAILRRDEGGEWVASLPARASERALARVLDLLALLAALALAWYVPWALLAPPAFPVPARLALPVLGLGLALFLATVLIWIQQLLLARFRAAFLVLETALVVLVVVGLLQLLGHLPEIALLEPASAWLAWFPPAWFARAGAGGASAWLVPAACTLACAIALFLVPPSEERAGIRASLLERWLAPLRRAAERTWVRADERGAFGLVFAALPREREVALRTAPMVGIPLSFLVIGALGEHGQAHSWTADLLALLLFTAGIYLPLLLTHVPLTETPEAAWILRTAPQPPGALVGGTLKALFVRWLLPLYLALFALGLALGEAGLLLRLWLPALLLVLLVLRVLYPRCVHDLPLSTAPEELRSDVDWAGLVATLAVGLTLAAVLAGRLLTWPAGLCLSLALLAVEVGLERRLRRTLG